MKKIKSLARKLTPNSIINAYHLSESVLYSKKYRDPSDQMITIGIVGSKGKTTTANLLWAALSASGEKVGQIGTANIRIADKEEMNKYHMTMPGAKIMQSILTQMLRAGCKYVITIDADGQHNVGRSHPAL